MIQVSANFYPEGDLLILKMDRLVDEIRFDRVSAQAFVEQLTAYLAKPVQKPMLRLVSTPSPITPSPSIPDDVVTELREQLKLVLARVDELAAKLAKETL